MTQAMDAEGLKRKLKAAGETAPEAWRTRLHRAISWLGRAERDSDDTDARFIFLWIAFNAAYASEFAHEQSERDRLRAFFAMLLSRDAGQRLAGLMLRQFSGPVRVLIENRYVYAPFWRALRDHDSSGRWEETFAASRKLATAAVMSGDTATVLSIVFDRLYVLRNQLLHGGATWNSAVNRAQVRDGATILSHTVPVIVDLMLECPEADFGAIQYPVV
jgi:hypothetical protein